jgi:sulfonate transport system substrate-binding protein
MSLRFSIRRTVVGALVPALLVAGLAACGSSNGSAATAKPQAADAKDVPASVPPGTTITVGDQLQLLQTVLKTGGQDTGFPYTIKWASFIGGPPMLQAFHAGAIDAGFVADTPLIFAQAAHQDVVAIAGWASQHGGNELIATPGSGISSWRDLEGKKVAYQQGTSAEATILQGLHGAGLQFKDIKSVNLPFTQVVAAMQGGSVQAGILTPPLDTAYLTAHPDANVVSRPDNITARVNFLIAGKSSLDNSAKAAALRDFILRLGKAFTAIRANPDEFVQKFYVDQYHLTLAAGKALLAKLGTNSFVELSGALIPAQQALADLYTAAGEIPDKLDAAAEFDTRYASVIREATAG